jgi:hypothetical protein
MMKNALANNITSCMTANDIPTLIKPYSVPSTVLKWASIALDKCHIGGDFRVTKNKM